MASRSRLAPLLRASVRRPPSTCRRLLLLRNPGLPTASARPLSTSAVRTAPQVQLTAEKYPEMQRGPFATLTAEHVAHFRSILGSDSAVIDGVTRADATDDLAPFNEDWMRKYRGQSRLVLRPATTQQVSEVLAYCNAQRLAVVPQGGNTGLVGGSVPVFDEIVLSMARMNGVVSFDEVSGVLVVEAGAILESTDQYLAERGYLFPLDLGAKGSCQIGGNVSTNAGGLRLLRYGSLHGSVLGLEAVLADGRVVDDLCTLRKNNTGYDVKQLFVGAEGTIGVITKVAVQCPQRPKAVNVAFFGLESFEQVQRAFREAKGQLGEILSAFELMDSESQRMVSVAKGASRPMDDYPFYCLIETSGSNGEHDYEKLEKFLEDVMDKEIVVDGVVAQDQTQITSLWGWREGIAEALGHWGAVYKYDVSIPLADMYKLVEDVRARMAAAGLVGTGSGDDLVVGIVGYGHMGDSNLHLNVAAHRYDARIEEVLEPFVYEWIAQRGGSISAEHGLGVAKKKFIGYSRNETVLGMMRDLKKLYDPNGIMNPYKYI